MIKSMLLSLAPLFALVPLDAHALVLVGNPGRLGVTLPDATDLVADASLTVVLEGCLPPGPVEQTSLTRDLAVGLELDWDPEEVCGAGVTVGDDLHIFGENDYGEFEIVVPATAFSATDDDLPMSLPYTVVAGVVTQPPVLVLD